MHAVNKIFVPKWLQSPSMNSKSSKCQTRSLIWVVDQDQLNPYVAYEGYVVRVPHNPLQTTDVPYFQSFQSRAW